MSAHDTGNGRNLPLSERAKRGLLLSELDLALDEVAALEYPTPGPARKAFAAALSAAIRYGDLAATIQRWQRRGPLVNRDFLRLPPIQQAPVQCVETRIDRESYRAWRATCPADLLSPLSQIHKWLGATPAIETSLPATSGKRQRDDALTHAIRAAIAVLSPDGALPRARELFDYLKTSDATKTIVDSGKDSLTWYSAETNKKQIATVANLKRRLDRWKT